MPLKNKVLRLASRRGLWASCSIAWPGTYSSGMNRVEPQVQGGGGLSERPSGKTPPARSAGSSACPCRLRACAASWASLPGAVQQHFSQHPAAAASHYKIRETSLATESVPGYWGRASAATGTGPRHLPSLVGRWLPLARAAGAPGGPLGTCPAGFGVCTSLCRSREQEAA